MGILSAYTDPAFIYIALLGPLWSLFCFLLFAIPLTYIAIHDLPWARAYRIQERRGDYQKIMPLSIANLKKNTLILWAATIVLWPLLYASGIHAGQGPALWGLILHVIFIAVIDDLAYYFMHRWLHSSWAYERFHTHHHRNTAVWAICGHDMHWVEYLLTTGCVLLGAMILGAHVSTIYLYIFLRQWETAEAHCGYQFPWSPSRFIPFYDGAVFHDFHHSKFTGNFAGLFSYLDRFFNTIARHYEEKDQRVAGKNTQAP